MGKFPLGVADNDRVAFDGATQLWQRGSDDGGNEIQFAADTVQDLELLTTADDVVVGSLGVVRATGNLYRATASTAVDSSWDPATGIFDVQDFGAVGDDVADDTVPIQTAVDRGRAYMPAGVYRTTASIVLATGSYLEGAGRRTTQIRPATELFAAIEVDASAGAVEGWTMTDLAVSYRTATGGLIATNALARGLRLIGGVSTPHRGLVERFEVELAFHALFDDTRGFLNTFSECMFVTCAHGISCVNAGGKTTYVFRQVYTNDCGGIAWELNGFQGGCVIIGGAMDHADSGAGEEPMRLSSGRYVLQGFDIESNTLEAAVADSASIINLSNASVVMDGCAFFDNHLNSDKTDQALIRVQSDSFLTITGTRNNSDDTDGNTTRAAALLVAGGANVVETNNQFNAIVGAGGRLFTDFSFEILSVYNSAVVRFRTEVVLTASLPAAAASQDGRVIIEDGGAGDRNLIIYGGGERFRIDGGVPF